MKKIKPIYIYLLAIGLFVLANFFNDIVIVYYAINILAGICFIWAVFKYFRK